MKTTQWGMLLLCVLVALVASITIQDARATGEPIGGGTVSATSSTVKDTLQTTNSDYWDYTVTCPSADFTIRVWRLNNAGDEAIEITASGKTHTAGTTVHIDHRMSVVWIIPAATTEIERHWELN